MVLRFYSPKQNRDLSDSLSDSRFVGFSCQILDLSDSLRRSLLLDNFVICQILDLSDSLRRSLRQSRDLSDSFRQILLDKFVICQILDLSDSPS